MFEIVKKLITEVTGKTNITYDTDFVQDLQLNSFDIMNLVCAFEDYFQTTISNKAVWQMRQVKDVVEYIESKGYTEEA